MDSPLPTRRVERVRHELKRRDLTVVEVARPTPGFVAVTLAGDSLADFPSQSFDDHVKVFFPAEGGESAARDYTPRAFSRDQGRLTIEFAMHGSGPADRWAAQAAPGQRLTVGGPRGSMVVPTDYDWHLLAGDASALPAIARRLEELPAGARVFAVVQAPAQDRRTFATQAHVQLQWVEGGEAMVEAIRALPWPAGEGYAWAAGEAPVMARVRQVLLEEKRHPKEAMRIAAYWKPGAAAHHENLE